MKKVSKTVALSIGLATCCAVLSTVKALEIDTNIEAKHGTNFHTLFLSTETNPEKAIIISTGNLLYISDGLIAGQSNNGLGIGSSIGGGKGNTVNGANAGIAGGRSNMVNGENGMIGGGEGNVAKKNATIIGGNNNSADEKGNILGGAGGSANSYGTVLGGENNTAGENSLVLGQDSEGGKGSFAWDARVYDNTAGINAENGVLIGTTEPLTGVDLVVNGSVKLNEGKRTGRGTQGEVKIVDGCFYLFDGTTWNVINQADTGNCQGWIVVGDGEGGREIPAKTCVFGKTELKEGDKVWAYSATMNPNCNSIKKEVVCKLGSLITTDGTNDYSYKYSYCYDGIGEEATITCENQPQCGTLKCNTGDSNGNLGDTSFTCTTECGTKNCNCSGTTKWNTSTNSCTNPTCQGTRPTFTIETSITTTEFKDWTYDPSISQACTYKCIASNCTSSHTLTSKNVTGAASYDTCTNYTPSAGNCIPTQKHKVTSCKTGYELKNGSCELVVCPSNTCTSAYTLSSSYAQNALTYEKCSNFSTDGLCTETSKWKISSCKLGNCDTSYTLTSKNASNATRYATCTHYELNNNNCEEKSKYKVIECATGYKLVNGQCKKDCTLDGETVAYGEYITGYLAPNPTCPTTCQGQRRQCTENGVLNGSSSYAYSSCNPQPVSCDGFNLTSSGNVSHAKTYNSCTKYTVSNKTCNAETKWKVTQCENGYHLRNGECELTSCGGSHPDNAITSTTTPTSTTLNWTYNPDISQACTYKCPSNTCTSDYTLTSKNVSNAKTYDICTGYSTDGTCRITNKYKVLSCNTGNCDNYHLTGKNVTNATNYDTCTGYTLNNNTCTASYKYRVSSCKPSNCTSDYNLTTKNVTHAASYSTCSNYNLTNGKCIETQKHKVTACESGFELNNGNCEPVPDVCPSNTCTSAYTLTSKNVSNARTYDTCSIYSTDGTCSETNKYKVLSCNLGNCDSSYTLTSQNVANAKSYATCTKYTLSNGSCPSSSMYKVIECESGFALYNGSCQKLCGNPCASFATKSGTNNYQTYSCSYGGSTANCTCEGDKVRNENGCTVPSDPCGDTVNACVENATFSDLTDTTTQYKWQCTLGSIKKTCSKDKEPSCGLIINSCEDGEFSDLTDTTAKYLWKCTLGSNSKTCDQDKPSCTCDKIKENGHTTTLCSNKGVLIGSTTPLCSSEACTDTIGENIYCENGYTMNHDLCKCIKDPEPICSEIIGECEAGTATDLNISTCTGEPSTGIYETARRGCKIGTETTFCSKGCFIAGTQVKMADGTYKAIEEIEVGDQLLGNEGVNTVQELFRPLLNQQTLWSINGSKAFVSESHPFMTTEGWKSMNPEASMQVVDEEVTLLEIGDILVTENGYEEVVALAASCAPADTQLYNFRVDGDHTYYANNYLVHNKTECPKSDCELAECGQSYGTCSGGVAQNKNSTTWECKGGTSSDPCSVSCIVDTTYTCPLGYTLNPTTNLCDSGKEKYCMLNCKTGREQPMLHPETCFGTTISYPTDDHTAKTRWAPKGQFKLVQNAIFEPLDWVWNSDIYFCTEPAQYNEISTMKFTAIADTTAGDTRIFERAGLGEYDAGVYLINSVSPQPTTRIISSFSTCTCGSPKETPDPYYCTSKPDNTTWCNSTATQVNQPSSYVSSCGTTPCTYTCSTNYTYSNGTCVYNGGTTCFAAGTQVKMADDSYKNIENIKIGEKIQGLSGVNTVLGYDRPKLGNRHLWSINGGDYFVSDEHPFLTTEGWKSFNPEMTKLEIDLNTTKLKIGDTIITSNGTEVIHTLDYKNDNQETQLYNFVLDGDHTYYANNYLVHNKGCFLPGTPIVTENGYKNIEDIEVGDRVRSYNEETNNYEFNTVDGVITHENNYEDVYDLSVDGKTISATEIHRFYVSRKINSSQCSTLRWISIKLIRPGDMIVRKDGTLATIDAITRRPHYGTVYNLSVENAHTYFVYDGYLVHNALENKGVASDDPTQDDGGGLSDCSNGKLNCLCLACNECLGQCIEG